MVENNEDMPITISSTSNAGKPQQVINIDQSKVIGTPEKDKVKIILTSDTYNKMAKHAKEDLSHELGGFLIGNYQENKEDVYVNIIGAIRAQATDSQSASLKFTHETWDLANKEKDDKYPDGRIIGWYHTHPTFGIFLSGYDQFIQKNFFDLPFQIAYVVDPVNKRDGFFHWDNGNITKSQGFYFSDTTPEQLWDMKFSSKETKVKIEEEDVYTKEELEQQRKIVLKERNENRKKYLYQIIIKYSSFLLLALFLVSGGLVLSKNYPLFPIKESSQRAIVLNKKDISKNHITMYLKFIDQINSNVPVIRVYLKDKRVKDWSFTKATEQGVWQWKKNDGGQYWYDQEAEIILNENVIYRFILRKDTNERITINIGGK